MIWKQLLQPLRNAVQNVLTIIVAIAVVVGCVWLYLKTSDDKAPQVVQTRQTRMLPAQVEWMKGIGQWEFLTISDEEVVEKRRKGFFSDDCLIRIYKGTLRLGIDTRKASAGWIVHRNDTVFVTLPPVELLDKDFIDESATVSFYEKGRWTEADRAAMYRQAAHMMRSGCLTKANVKKAEDIGAEKVKQFITAFKKVTVVVKYEKKRPAQRK